MKINRSNFLKKIVLGITTVTAIGQTMAQETTSEDNTIQNVTIVGAGLAGLYSAYLLKNSGYDVTIIEAKKRIGGRILTVRNEETQLFSELGGEWIQENHFTMKSLCKELDIELKPYPIQKDVLLGDKLIESNNVKENANTKEIIKRIISLYEKMSEEKKQGLDKLDIHSFLKYQGVTEEQLYLLNMKYSVIFGENLRNISAEKAIRIFNSHETESISQYKIQLGSDKIIEKLKSKLKDVTFITGDPIISVDDNEDDFIKIITKSGKEIKSDACIFAIPPGQLDKINFSPELPKDTKLALLQIGISRMTKVSVIYKGVTSVKDNLYVLSDGIFQSIYSNANKNKSLNKGLLSIISTGDRSEVYSKLASENLNSFFKKNVDYIGLLSTLKIEKVQLKVWQNDPYIEGATSIYAQGSFEVKSILKRNHGRIYFAGEHLGNHNGTMESALLSAIEAVNSL